MPVATAGSKTIFSHFNPLPQREGYRTGCFPLYAWSRKSRGAVSLYTRGRRDRTGLFPPLLVVERIARGCFSLCPWLMGSYGPFFLSACSRGNRSVLFPSMLVVDGIVRGFFPLSLWERAGVRASDPTTRRRYPSDGVPPKFNNL